MSKDEHVCQGSGAPGASYWSALLLSNDQTAAVYNGGVKPLIRERTAGQAATNLDGL